MVLAAWVLYLIGLQCVYLKIVARIKWLRVQELVVSHSCWHPIQVLLASLILGYLQFHPHKIPSIHTTDSITLIVLCVCMCVERERETLARRSWLLLCKSTSCKLNIGNLGIKFAYIYMYDNIQQLRKVLLAFRYI